MSERRLIKVPARNERARPTLEQDRFRFLLAEIDKVRRAHSELEAVFAAYRRDHTEKLAPLRAALRETCRDCIFALDALLDQPGWSRLDQSVLSDLLRSMAAALIDSGQGDSEIIAVFDKHNPVSFETLQAQRLAQLKAQAEEMGFDLDDADDIRTEEELRERIYEQAAAREEMREAAQRRGRRKSASEKRAEDSAKAAKQTLRELYRKLASIVHPDRERDPARRHEKNLLMQKINQAYATNDLMGLCEAQMQVEQTNAEEISQLGATRLKQYNKLLSEQLAKLKAALHEAKERFLSDLGLPPMQQVNAQALGRHLKAEARRMREEIARRQQLLEVLGDRAATKRWLKLQRQLAHGVFDDDLEPW